MPEEPTTALRGSTNVPPMRSEANDPAPADIDSQLLLEQRAQTTALKEALPCLVSELGVLSRSGLDIRGDTQALVAHLWQLVGAVSGLAMSVGALVRAQQATNESLVRILERLSHDDKPSDAASSTPDVRAVPAQTRVGLRSLRKRKSPPNS